MPFSCTICEENSTRICVRCTKDTCTNHLCEKCGACSDCCACELQLENEHVEFPAEGINLAGPHDPRPEPLPDPEPDPDPDEPDPEEPFSGTPEPLY